MQLFTHIYQLKLIPPTGSGYNIIEQWLKYHRYAYYRKACSNDDIHDLLNLIGRIAEYQTEAAISDGIMKMILNGDLINPIK